MSLYIRLLVKIFSPKHKTNQTLPAAIEKNKFYLGIFTHIQAYSEIIQAYSEAWNIQNLRHIQNPVKHLRLCAL